MAGGIQCSFSLREKVTQPGVAPISQISQRGHPRSAPSGTSLVIGVMSLVSVLTMSCHCHWCQSSLFALFQLTATRPVGQSCSVPRKLRMEYPGAIYHVINRGDRREDIFRHDEDRLCFLSTLGEACQKTRWQVH